MTQSARRRKSPAVSFWQDLGIPPSADEIEVTVIGPGFGECIIIHIGDGRWIVIDSCKDPVSKKAVALEYLSAIGVDPSSSVDFVVATHWHRDHIAGLSDIVEECTKATFACATVLSNMEFLKYAALSRVVTRIGDNAKEFRTIFKTINARNLPIVWIQHGHTLLHKPSASVGPLRIEALSPSSAEFQDFLQQIASDKRKRGDPHRAIATIDPNHVAVVLAMHWTGSAALFGADLLMMNFDLNRGWLAAVTAGGQLAVPASSLVKIPHHGSKGAHCNGMWTQLLAGKPEAVITPYSRGEKAGRPPTPTDIKRIKDLSSRTVLTAPTQAGRARAKHLPISLGLAQSGITMRSLKFAMGMARYRRKAGAIHWASETFGRAKIV